MTNAMYLVMDNATNNVLDECATLVHAEQRRVEIVGANPELAEYIEVVDLERTVAAYRRERGNAGSPAEAQPA